MNNKTSIKTNSTLTERQLIKLLTVKAVEEQSPSLFPQLTVSNANIAAIGAKNDTDFLVRRSVHLFKFLPSSLKNTLSFSRFPQNWLNVTLAFSIVAGLLSNYLGPSKLIHVIYNPLTILLAWNFLVYLILILKSLLNIGLFTVEKPIQALINILPERKNDAEENKEISNKEKRTSGNFILDWIIGGLYKRLISFKARVNEDSEKIKNDKKIWISFWNSYKETAGTSLLFRFRSLMNYSTVGLVIGALAGVYLRGLFFNYNMVWQSTFVSDAATIRIFLNVFLGPASLLLDGSLINLETVKLLLQPGGTSAAPWIHKLALSAFLFVVIPRILLATGYLKLAKRKVKTIDLSQAYFGKILNDKRDNLIKVIREGIKDIITRKINQTSRSITNFVIDDYFEKIIVPRLIEFRSKGGKIRKLEKALFDSQDEFEPILLRYLNKIQNEFSDAVLTEINLFFGRKFDIEISASGNYQAKSDNIDQKLPSKLAEDIGDTLSGTLVTAIAVAAGSISGGLGKSLGIAIISGLLGVSGPIGLLIGSVITAAALAGIYKMGRDQISDLIKDVYLPSVVVKLALSDTKINEARKETHSHTQNEIKNILEPRINEVTETILKDITY